MNQIKINSAALDNLSKQNFAEAQSLFFENARNTPSHETYNNLGYFLCTEGLECKNGRVRNADKLGLSYLLKAEKLNTTSVNQSNIAGELEKQRAFEFSKTGIDAAEICNEALRHAETAVRLKYSNELEYNRLRFLFLCDKRKIDVLNGMKELVCRFENDDAVEFLLNLYCLHSEFNNCLRLISEYRDRLDAYCLLSLYCRCGDFDSGAALCVKVYEQFVPDDTIVAMMAECLINTGEYSRADMLRVELENNAPEYCDTDKFLTVVKMAFNSSEYRKTVIQNYCYRPGYMVQCGYFGCKIHGIPFFESVNGANRI